MTKHNKKRNTGIIYELFAKHISNLVISGKRNDVKKATRILEKRFKKNTELYKEFRIFNALVNANISSRDKATIVVENSKKDIQKINQKKLNSEKSKLIKEINYDLNDKNFYFRTVPHYREYANIQNLFNEWKKGDMSNLKLVLEQEEKAINWLVKEKTNNTIDENVENEGANALVVKIMTEKINNKYSNMSSTQKQIIQNYALYSTNDNKFIDFLKSKKNEVLQELKSFQSDCDNQVLLEKISLVELKIKDLNTDNDLTDGDIVKFLTVAGLLQELKTH